MPTKDQSWIIPSNIIGKDPLISITVVGSGYGESVIVNVGGVFLGFIDSCNILIPQNRKIKRQNLLKSILTKNKNAHIGFILLTHPHLDHFLGMENLYEKFGNKVYRACLFQGTTELEIKNILETQSQYREIGNHYILSTIIIKNYYQSIAT